MDEPSARSGRQLVSTASLAVRTDDVLTARARATATTEAAGGQVFGEQTDLSSKARTILTLKVPPERFQAVLADLARLGTALSQEIKTDDVTDRVIDLDARIVTAETSVGRARDLLARSTNLVEAAKLEDEVSQRESALEKLRGEKRTLADRVDLATIVLTLSADPAPAPPPPAPPPAGFTDGLARGWDVLTEAARVASVLVGVLVPFTPVLLVAALGWRAWRRRHPARPRLVPPAPTAGPLPPPGPPPPGPPGEAPPPPASPAPDRVPA